MNFDLTEGWFAGVKRGLEPYGMKFVVRDANWSTNAGAQAVTTLISEKPAAIIVHNPDVQTYAKLLQRAEDEGIYVIQINMGSSYRTSAFVGANWIEIGERDTEAVVKACQGKSNKIAIIQGALSAAASAYTLKGVENVLAKHPEVKVVSSQAADWDAAKAKAITQTVLKQNPDLCGIVGFWDGMDIGTAAAVKEAGLTGKVFVATSGGGEQKGACDLVKSGAFDLDLSYDVPTQAADMVAIIKWLLSSGMKPGIVEGLDLYDAHPDDQGQCRRRRHLLEARTTEAVARPRAPGRGRHRLPRPIDKSPGCSSRSIDERSRSASALSLLAGSSAGRDPVEAMDRDGHPGDRPADRRRGLQPVHPGFLSPASLADTARQAAEIGFVVLGMALVIVVGGIDLSVGSIFALSDFCALFCLDVLELPVPAVRRHHHRVSARCSARSMASSSAICGCAPSSPR